MALNDSEFQGSEEHRALLASVAQQLKQPLLFIRNQAELMQLNGQALDPQQMYSSAQSGILLAEHYLTWHEYSLQNKETDLAQYGMSAVIHDVAIKLKEIAYLNQVSLKLEIRGKHAPVNTDEKLLTSGLSALGLAFIDACSHEKNSEVTFGVHASRWGIVAGVYSTDVSIKADEFKRQRKLVGTAKQLYPATSHTTMSGIAVARALFNELNAPLKPSKHNHMDGLAITLSPSPQLSLL